MLDALHVLTNLLFTTSLLRTVINYLSLQMLNHLPQNYRYCEKQRKGPPGSFPIMEVTTVALTSFQLTPRNSEV